MTRSRSSSSSQRLRRDGTVTITLRFQDGQCEYRLSTAHIGGGSTFRPFLLGTLSLVRARKLLDALLTEVTPPTGGDVLCDQLSLGEWSGL
jgi:hypothetical protein